MLMGFDTLSFYQKLLAPGAAMWLLPLKVGRHRTGLVAATSTPPSDYCLQFAPQQPVNSCPGKPSRCRGWQVARLGYTRQYWPSSFNIRLLLSWHQKRRPFYKSSQHTTASLSLPQVPSPFKSFGSCCPVSAWPTAGRPPPTDTPHIATLLSTCSQHC